MDEENCRSLLNHFEKIQKDAKIEKFISERLALIKDNKYPIQLSSETPSRYMMHIFPHNYEENYLDIKQLLVPENYFLPHGEHENENIVPDFNFDGITFATSLHEKRGYTQVFRDGRVEFVTATGRFDPQRGNVLSLFKIQYNTLFRTALYFKILKKFGIKGPYTLYVRMFGMQDIKLDLQDLTRSGYEGKGGTRALVRDVLIFPCIIIDDESKLNETIKPLFDIFWNIFGLPETPEAIFKKYQSFPQTNSN